MSWESRYDDWKINGNWHYCTHCKTRWSDSDGGCECEYEIECQIGELADEFRGFRNRVRWALGIDQNTFRGAVEYAYGVMTNDGFDPSIQSPLDNAQAWRDAAEALLVNAGLLYEALGAVQRARSERTTK